MNAEHADNFQNTELHLFPIRVLCVRLRFHSLFSGTHPTHLTRLCHRHKSLKRLKRLSVVNGLPG